VRGALEVAERTLAQPCVRVDGQAEHRGEHDRAPPPEPLGQRAEDGARKIYHIITDKRSPDHTDSIGGSDPLPAGDIAQDTLTSDDLAAEWHLPETP